MDTSACTTIVLALLWLYLCCQILGSLVTLVGYYSHPELLQQHSLLYSTTSVIPTSTTLSTILLGVCLWQCKKAGYLVTPMTWYHWVLLVLLVLLQVVVVLTEYLGLQGFGSKSVGGEWTSPIYAIIVVILAILGGTLFCGWKCNLFCRPCCKSQYICYGSAIVVVLVVITVLAVTSSIGKYQRTHNYGVGVPWFNEILSIGYLDYMVIPITQCYTTAVLWNTTLRLPYTVPEVVTLLLSTLSVASISALALASVLALAVSGSTHRDGGLSTAKAYHLTLLNTAGYPLLALHLLALCITLYCLEYKRVFQWPKDYMCFGLLAAVLLIALILLLVVKIVSFIESEESINVDAIKYTLLGYSMVLMVLTLWYAYRCGLLTWRWNSCIPKKNSLKATDTAENTAAEIDIAKES